MNNGDFSVKHFFANYGVHQITVRVDTNSTKNSTSFKVITSYQSPSQFLTDSVKSKLDNDKNNEKFMTWLVNGVGVAVSGIMPMILLSKLKKIIIIVYSNSYLYYMHSLALQVLL